MGSKKVYTVTLGLDYLMGHLRYGHFKAVLTEKQFKEFEGIADPEEKEEFIRDYGEIVVDDYEVSDWESNGDIDVLEETVTQPVNGDSSKLIQAKNLLSEALYALDNIESGNNDHANQREIGNAIGTCQEIEKFLQDA